MEDNVQTWHYGLVARHWAEHNTSGPEITYYQQQIQTHGQPALYAERTEPFKLILDLLQKYFFPTDFRKKIVQIREICGRNHKALSNHDLCKSSINSESYVPDAACNHPHVLGRGIVHI